MWVPVGESMGATLDTAPKLSGKGSVSGRVVPVPSPTPGAAAAVTAPDADPTATSVWLTAASCRCLSETYWGSKCSGGGGPEESGAPSLDTGIDCSSEMRACVACCTHRSRWVAEADLRMVPLLPRPAPRYSILDVKRGEAMLLLGKLVVRTRELPPARAAPAAAWLSPASSRLAMASCSWAAAIAALAAASLASIQMAAAAAPLPCWEPPRRCSAATPCGPACPSGEHASAATANVFRGDP